MNYKTQLLMIYAFIGLIVTAIVLIGGAYFVTSGEVGGMPSPAIIIMLPLALLAERWLRAKAKDERDAR